jgi:DNA modification methylase
VIVNKRTGHVVDGHLRVATAISNDEPTVPVLYVDLTEEEEKKILLTIDPIAGMAAIDDEKFRELVAEVEFASEDARRSVEAAADAAGVELDEGEPEPAPEAQIDRAAELNKKWQVKSGDLWRIGEHRLLCGDSTSRQDYSKIVAPIDLFFSDPPYGVAINVATKGGRQIEGDLSMAAIPAAFAIAFDDLGDGCWIYMCGGWSNAPLWFRLFDAHCHMIPHLIVWVKENFVMRQSGYHSQFELIYAGWKKGGAHRNTHWFGDRKETDVWQIKHDKSGEMHPTIKPAELVERAVRNSCQPGGTVYDPFLGSGTTMVACENLGRKCRGIEISPDYCAVILERMSDMGLKPERIG